MSHDTEPVPRKRHPIRVKQIDRSLPDGRPHKCPVCGCRLEYDTDGNGRTLELVWFEGKRYVHECRG